MDGALAGVIDLVGDAGEIRINAGQVKVVVYLVEQVAEGRGVAITGADETGKSGRELLLDRFFQDRAAHDRARRVKTKEKTAGGFVEVAVRFVGARRRHDALAEFGGAGNGRLDEIEKFERERGAEQVVLLGVEGALDLLPGGSARRGG